MIQWLSEQNCLFVEQPMPKEKIDEQAWLHERAPLPIIADEFLQRMPDVRRAYGLYDGINIKLMKSTGMQQKPTEWPYWQSFGYESVTGWLKPRSPVPSLPRHNCRRWPTGPTFDGNLLISNDLFDGVKIVEGKITLLDRPGIGVVPL